MVVQNEGNPVCVTARYRASTPSVDATALHPPSMPSLTMFSGRNTRGSAQMMPRRNVRCPDRPAGWTRQPVPCKRPLLKSCCSAPAPRRAIARRRHAVDEIRPGRCNRSFAIVLHCAKKRNVVAKNRPSRPTTELCAGGLPVTASPLNSRSAPRRRGSRSKRNRSSMQFDTALCTISPTGSERSAASTSRNVAASPDGAGVKSAAGPHPE